MAEATPAFAGAYSRDAIRQERGAEKVSNEVSTRVPPGSDKAHIDFDESISPLNPLEKADANPSSRSGRGRR
jgi:hypothetical protein